MSKKNKAEKLTLDFDLHELPTAQHRAGLAGLILQIDAMGPKGYRRDTRLIPVIEDLTADTAKISFTADSIQGVFDELYSAELFDRRFSAPKKKKGKEVPPDEIETSIVDGKEKIQYVYRNDGVRPLAPGLTRHITQDSTSWVELWRRMVWEILRNEQARAPFKQVARAGSCSLGASMWDLLAKMDQVGSSGRAKPQRITEALMIGAQSANAEAVPFLGRGDHYLLLHFWQLVILTFVPQVISKKGKKDAKAKPLGYVLAVPDVANLVDFREEFPAILQNLEANEPGHTPAKARLNLPSQAGLETLRRLRDTAQKAARISADSPKNVELVELAETSEGHHKSFSGGLLANQRRDRVNRRGTHQAFAAGVAAREWDNCVRAVETYHMFKPGNSAKLLGFTRVVDRPGLVEGYETIDKSFRNPLFRAGMMRALIDQQARHRRMIELFSEYPHRFFLEIEGETPKYIPRFGRDARALFNAHQQEIRKMTPEEMNEDDTFKRLGTIVRSLINGYVNRRAAKKLNEDWDSYKTEVKDDGRKHKVIPNPEKFAEQQRRICNDAFLQLRSRHDEDFVAFFAGSICSVPQYFSGKAGELPFLMQILMTPPPRDPVAVAAPNRDDIKTLTMLALSAYSFNVRKRDARKEEATS